MFFVVPVIVLTTLLLVFFALRGRIQHASGTRHIRHFAYPHAWLEPLEAVPFYRSLPMDLREDFQDKVLNFIDGKRWRPGDGLNEITDQMKVVIAANASAVTLARGRTDDLRAVLTVQIHPVDKVPATPEARQALLDGEGASSTVYMAWDEATGTAHAIQDEDSPELSATAAALAAGPQGQRPSFFAHAPWARVAAPAFLTDPPQVPGGPSGEEVLASLQPEDPVEVFAAATEAFLTNPRQLAQRQAGLYAGLRDFYRIDPARWRQTA